MPSSGAIRTEHKFLERRAHDRPLTGHLPNMFLGDGRDLVLDGQGDSPMPEHGSLMMLRAGIVDEVLGFINGGKAKGR